MIGILKKQFNEAFSADLPPQETEADFILFNERISFKTTISKSFKLIWTANFDLAMQFYKNFTPNCSILAMVFQESVGGLYYFPIEVLLEEREKMGLAFLNKPKASTNPRGVSLSTKAFNELAKNKKTKIVRIDWNDYNDSEVSTAINLVDHYYKLW